MRWILNYNEGLHQIRTGVKKLMLVNFTADWCEWCQQLDQDLSNAKTTSFIDNTFINVKIDVDQNESLTKNFQVIILPTIIFIAENGKEVGRLQGYKPPIHFLIYAINIVNQYG